MKRIFVKFRKSVEKMSKKEHLFYWILPSFILGVLMIFYFSGIPPLVEIVAPKKNREWGMLENIQLLILLGMIYLSAKSVLNNEPLLQKGIFGFIGILSVFVFLEELDYGAHFRELFYGERRFVLKDLIGVDNIHNEGGNARLIKRFSYLIMGSLFVVSPFFKKNGFILC